VSGRRWVGLVVTCAAVASCARGVASVDGSASDLSAVEAPSVDSLASSAPGAGPSTGVITGVATDYGGPYVPNGQGQLVDAGTPAAGTTLTAVEDGNPVVSVITKPDGTYRFVLAPGTYVIVGCSGDVVTLGAGRVVHLNLQCDIP
jgi:hypothetical protein